ncbi:MAG: hypothetical protein HYZ28_16715, partial [Myxococcales bacterium]|nr:hypothetical protein [Myxococcales bacterium]
MSRALSLLALLFGALAAGCFNPAPATLCEGVSCPDSTLCNPDNGQCEAVGSPDAGTSCDPACSGATPVCDTAAGSCKACTASEGCSGQTPVCDTAANQGQGACVSCTSAAGCAPPTPICDTALDGGACVGCLGSGDCSGATPICHPDSRTCVAACAANTDCAAPTPVCDTAQGLCVGCLGNSDCSGSTPVCDGAAQVCVVCSATSGCSAPTPLCDTSAPGGRCVQCLGSAGCAAPTPACDTSTGTCVGCLSNADCNAGAPVCNPSSRTCVGCTTSADCANPNPVCSAAGACVACSSSAQCGAGKICDASGACLALPDTCALAQPLTFPVGSDTLSFTAEPSLGLDDHDGTCNSTAKGRELVYKLTLASARDITIRAARATGSSADPVIYLRASPCDTGTQLACAQTAGFGGAQETISLFNRPAGDYFLFVESAGTTSGRISVTVTLGWPTVPPSNDDCATASALTFTNGAATASGDNTLANNDNSGTDPSPSCTTSAKQSGKDLVYSYTLTAPKDVTITVQPSAGSALRPAVYVRKPGACSSTALADEVGCRATGSVGSQVLTLLNQQPGTYSIWVDAVWSSTGPFVLDVVASDPQTNDSCAGAKALTFVGGNATETGNTTLASNDNGGTDPSPSCSNSAKQTGHDLIYSFTTTAAQDVEVTVTPSGTNPTYEPVVYLRKPNACASTSLGDELGCQADFTPTPQTLKLLNLSAGTYYVWVDSARGTSGAFTLAVKLSAPTLPPSNDSCSAPEALSFAGGTATSQGDTTGALNDNASTDASPTCSTTAKQSGKDLVYSFTLASPAAVQVVVTPTGASPTFQPVVYVRRPNACSSPASADQLACQATFTPVAQTINLPTQAAGTYTIWVDSAQGTAGPFSIAVTVLSPPANDSCSSPLALAFDGGTALLSGDTSLAFNDNAGSDVSPTCSSTAKQSGRDLVYSYTTSGAQDVSVTLTPTSTSLNPVLYVRRPGSCANSSCTEELDCRAALGSGARRISLYNQPADTYFVWVDGAQGTAGTFSLSVQLSAPTLPPANDSCGGAQALSFAGNVATASGTTLTATNSNSCGDPVPTCSMGARLNGEDLIYTYTLSTNQDVGITLAPAAGSTLFPALYVRAPNACGSLSLSDELGCVAAGSAQAVSLSLLNQPPGTYYVFADAEQNSGGAFNLAVTLFAPTPPPSNDTCAAPTNLIFAGNVASATATSVGATNSNSPTDLAPTCGTNGYPKNFGRDVVFSYTLSQAQDVGIQVTPSAGSSLVPAVYVRRPGACSSGSPGDELGCAYRTSATPVSLSLYNQPAGTYTLFVDGNSPATGTFTVAVTLAPATPPPANDTCATASLLSQAVLVTGTNVSASDDYSSTSGPAYSSPCDQL